MDSEYTFQIKDLPMYIAIIFFILYIFYLFTLGAQTVYHNKQKEMIEHTTRTISPKLGLFGFFGFFYEGKMSDTFMDERYKENKMKVQMTVNKIALTIIGIAVFILVEV